MSNRRWLYLFDTGEVEHLVDLVRLEIKAQAWDDYEPRLYLSLADLKSDIWSYILDKDGIDEDGRVKTSRVHIDRAFKLWRFIGPLADRIQHKALDPSDADELERRFLDFIAHGSASRIYHDIPKTQIDRKKGGHESGTTRQAVAVERKVKAALALHELQRENPVKRWRLDDIEKKLRDLERKPDFAGKPDPEEEPEIKLKTLRNITMKVIQATLGGAEALQVLRSENPDKIFALEDIAAKSDISLDLLERSSLQAIEATANKLP